jgi:NAD(P)H-dependent FMN reductase
VPAPVADLLDRIRSADAVLICTPEYAGGLPGSLKNLLDWTVGGGELYEKPVAWLDVANPGRGEGARAQLAVVLGYVGARIVQEACVHVPVERNADGVAVAPGAQPELVQAVTVLLGS